MLRKSIEPIAAEPAALSVLTRFLARRWAVAPRLFTVLSSPLPRRMRPGASLRLAHHWRYQTNLWRGRTSPARQQVPLRLHRPCPGFDVSKRRYKIVVATEKSVKTFKVICAVTGETISIHESRTQAEAAVRRYQAADARRHTIYYPGDMS